MSPNNLQSHRDGTINNNKQNLYIMCDFFFKCWTKHLGICVQQSIQKVEPKIPYEIQLKTAQWFWATIGPIWDCLF